MYYYNKCGLCKLVKKYPLVKIPLGPPQYEADKEAEEAGLNVSDGIVRYASFCLSCAKSHLSKLTEEYLTDGTVVVPKETT